MRARYQTKAGRVGLRLLVAIGWTLVVGCASTGEPDNVSERPWSNPQSWEQGLPPEMFQRR